MRDNALDEVQPLLQAMLAYLRRARATPLQFGIDSDRIGSAALCECLGETAAARDEERDWSLVITTLDELVADILKAGDYLVDGRNSGFARGLVKPIATASQPNGASRREAPPGHPLADWLDRFHAVMCERHPRAVEMVAMKVEGFEDRDVAERLKLGLRLVKQIAEDLHMDWLRAESGVTPC